MLNGTWKPSLRLLPVEEDSTATSGLLEGEAAEDLNLTLSKTEVAVILREISHTLPERIDRAVPGPGGHRPVTLRGQLSGEAVQWSHEVGHEGPAVGRRGCSIRAYHGHQRGPWVGEGRTQ